MILSDFLMYFATKHGPESLEGAIVFVGLARPLDDLIRLGLGFGPFHPGKDSPWSHTFLIAEPFRGADTAIIECSIRDENNAVIWDASLTESLIIVATGMAGKAGGIYDGRVHDYDDNRVLTRGVKYLSELSPEQRKTLLPAAKALQRKGYRYDFPGLFRELLRLTTGIRFPANDKLLFCSAFVQKAYRDALGDEGNIADRSVASADVTPDELWYSLRGVKEADDLQRCSPSR